MLYQTQMRMMAWTGEWRVRIEGIGHTALSVAGVTFDDNVRGIT